LKDRTIWYWSWSISSCARIAMTTGVRISFAGAASFICSGIDAIANITVTIRGAISEFEGRVETWVAISSIRASHTKIKCGIWIVAVTNKRVAIEIYAIFPFDVIAITDIARIFIR